MLSVHSEAVRILIISLQPTVLYRVYGGKANEMGRYWTTTPPSGPVQSIIDSALLPEWGNNATKIVKIEIPPGTIYFRGVAGPQGGLVGGGTQIYIPLVSPDWVMK